MALIQVNFVSKSLSRTVPIQDVLAWLPLDEATQGVTSGSIDA